MVIFTAVKRDCSRVFHLSFLKRREMLTVLLLFNFVECDWVEITQLSKSTEDSILQKEFSTTTPTYDTFLMNTTAMDEDDNVNTNPIDDYTVNDDETTESRPNYKGFMPFLNMIQSALIKKPHNTLKGKIVILQNLRDNLLFDISNKIASLWKSPNESRQARGFYEDHEMDFPSNEGALMTIGFLTFSVFLVKLVLKLILTLKNQNGTVVTPVFVGRKRRNVKNEEHLKILELIEQYKFN